MACAGIHLFLQMADVRIHVGRLRVALRIAGAGNVKAAVLAADVADKVGGVVEIGGRF